MEARLPHNQTRPFGRIDAWSVHLNIIHQAPEIYYFRQGPRARIPIPFISASVCAGFPSPADDHLEGVIDLNELCIEQPAATYFIRASGKSMTGGISDIHDGDILVVNRAVRPQSGHIVIACLDGEFCVKRLRLGENRAWLDSDNAEFPSISVDPEMEMTIWGVVRSVVRQIR